MKMGNWRANLLPFFLTRTACCKAVGVAGILVASALPQLAQAQAVAPPGGVAPSDEQSYRKEFVFGVNFNTQGGLVGGASVRSSRVLDEQWLRFWSLEAVMFKNNKEQREVTRYGGSYIYRKVNYAFSVRPSFGIQRILFRKAADSGVQVNGLVSAGPSLGLLMPYYITYDRTPATSPSSDPEYYKEEPYDPGVHSDTRFIVDRASLFAGAGKTQLVPGAHLRAGLSFEYGRYRDAVAGLETGFLFDAYAKPLTILRPTVSGDGSLDRQFFPSVYLTLYFGHRS